jgi:hypothetical protein
MELNYLPSPKEMSGQLNMELNIYLLFFPKSVSPKERNVEIKMLPAYGKYLAKVRPDPQEFQNRAAHARA